MKKCLDCGAQNDATADWCITCGCSLSGARQGGEVRKTELRETPVPAGPGTPPPLASSPQAPRQTAHVASAQPQAGGGRRRTMLDEGAAAPAAPVVHAAPPPQPGARKKTMLDEGPVSPPAQEGGAPAKSAKPAGAAPMAVGWMVSFDVNASGQDHVIREGRNSIGRSRDMDISLFYDTSASEHHADLIYHRGRGVCGVKDQGSQNGTFINGEDLGLGGSKDLSSGDILKIGKSTFKVFLLDRAEAAETWKSVWGEK